jgi:hypothetical protein
MKAAKQENRNSFTVPNSKLSVKESMDISVYIYIYIYTHIDKVAKREEYFLIILNNECRLSPLLRRKTPEQNNNRQPKKRGKTHTQSLHILSANVCRYHNEPDKKNLLLRKQKSKRKRDF